MTKAEIVKQIARETGVEAVAVTAGARHPGL